MVPADCGHDDGQGGFNRYITVPDENTELEDVCFSSCDPCSVGIGENSGSLNKPGFIALSPNPFTNSLKVQYILTANADVKISIVNIYGQVIHDSYFVKMGAGEYVFKPEIKSLPKGIYFCSLEVKSDNQVYTELKKIIKQ